MIRISLFCSSGMSTSMVVNKMKEAAIKRGIEVDINAYPESEMSDRVDNLDVALLGPQVKYLKGKAEEICGPKGVPVEVINPIDYGMMNGEKVLDVALDLLEK